MEPKTKKLVIVLAIVGAVLVLLITLGAGLLGYYGYQTAKNMALEDLNFAGTGDGSNAGTPSWLTDTQAAMLTSWGIDPASLPSSITEAQINCAMDAVGEARVQEIISGGQPTVSEIYNAISCLQLL
ncbi:MAG: hypothetical protein WCT24_02010 [Patescibacteria group bacterium]